MNTALVGELPDRSRPPISLGEVRLIELCLSLSVCPMEKWSGFYHTKIHPLGIQSHCDMMIRGSNHTLIMVVTILRR